MATSAKDERLDVRLPAETKQIIEEAAAYLGQSVSHFVVGTLLRRARQVLQQRRVTRLSNEDRDIFLALLDDADAVPNAALKRAAARYKKTVAPPPG